MKLKTSSYHARFILAICCILLFVPIIALAATTIQSWQSPTTGTTIFGIDSTGSLNLASSTNAYTSSSGTQYAITAGTLTIAQPFSGSAYKKVIIGATSLTSSGNSALVFSTSFTQTPAVLAMSMGTNGKTYSLTTSGTGAVLTPSSTGATLSASNSAASGYFILEGN